MLSASLSVLVLSLGVGRVWNVWRCTWPTAPLTVSRFHLDLIDSSRLASQPAPGIPCLSLPSTGIPRITTVHHHGVCGGGDGTDVNPREHSSGAILFVFCFVLLFIQDLSLGAGTCGEPQISVHLGLSSIGVCSGEQTQAGLVRIASTLLTELSSTVWNSL